MIDVGRHARHLSGLVRAVAVIARSGAIEYTRPDMVIRAHADVDKALQAPAATA